MRLLDVDSLAICEFTEDHVPPYAILSHKWGEEEVTFKDMIKGIAKGLKGYQKISECCKLAALDGFEYWIDTCCIDKRSSAELSEAINSMFRWYQESMVCYAYLEDVRKEDGWDSSDDINHGQAEKVPPPTFYSSKWFTRGWTLQELIAPPFVVFYSKEWSCIGTRSTLKRDIIRITGVSADALNGGYPEGFSVAQKMSWASARKTTKREDEAYCLLGLFGVSMPLVYGEGAKAFRRLQEEIMKYSDDETIFTPYSDDFLAQSPEAFRKRGSFKCSEYRVSTPFSITNKGVQISLPLMKDSDIENGLWKERYGRTIPWEEIDPLPHTTRTLLAILNCHMEGYEDRCIAFHITETKDRGIYTRNPGFLSMPAKIAKKYATVERILISITGDEENTSSYLMSTDPKRVLIMPFPAAFTPVLFTAPFSMGHYGLRAERRGNGVVEVEVSLSKGFVRFESGRITEGEPTALAFSTVQGSTVLISLGFKSEDSLVAAIGRIETAANMRDWWARENNMWLLHEAKRLLEASLAKQPVAYLPWRHSTTAVTVRVRNTGHAPVVTIHTESRYMHTSY
ncbi:heterokaryon incompatibility protein-domain-containing protein [Nemania sp. FL0031]|nr:heterokaryon incompatibility protein-domain-containing protein [Nemania sp. FL0031]